MIYSLSLIVPSVIAIAVLAWFVVRRTRLGFVLTLVFSTLALLPWAFASWFFRDGLGPDATPSSGAQAWVHVWDGFWLPFTIWIAVVVFAIYRSKRDKGS